MTAAETPDRRVRTVFLGSGQFGVEPLRRLAAHPDIALLGVVTAPPRPSGRDRRATQTPVDAAARELGVEAVLTPTRLRAPEAIDEILALGPDLAVLVDYGQIVPLPILELPLGALNLHPSLLPRHRGASPIPATILAGDSETGVTLMRMDAGLDTGPIVAIEQVPLRGDETAPELEASLERVGADLLERSVGPWVRGELAARPQPDHGATMTRPLRRDDGRLDPTRAAADLERQVRAYQPWPGSWLETPLGRLTIWRATATGGGPAAEAGPRAAPGTILPDGLATTNGRLRLEEVQPAGGTRMTWAAFVRGRPAIVGTRVVDPAPGPGRGIAVR